MKEESKNAADETYRAPLGVPFTPAAADGFSLSCPCCGTCEGLQLVDLGGDGEYDLVVDFRGACGHEFSVVFANKKGGVEAGWLAAGESAQAMSERVERLAREAAGTTSKKKRKAIGPSDEELARLAAETEQDAERVAALQEAGAPVNEATGLFIKNELPEGERGSYKTASAWKIEHMVPKPDAKPVLMHAMASHKRVFKPYFHCDDVMPNPLSPYTQSEKRPEPEPCPCEAHRDRDTRSERHGEKKAKAKGKKKKRR